MLVYPADIDNAIEKIKQAGGKVSRKTHVIYASINANFTSDHYPLEIVVSDSVPPYTDVIVAERRPLLELGNLQGEEGNAYVILGRASKVAETNGLDWEAIKADAMSSDYRHLLDVMRKHFDVRASGYES